MRYPPPRLNLCARLQDHYGGQFKSTRDAWHPERTIIEVLDSLELKYPDLIPNGRWTVIAPQFISCGAALCHSMLEQHAAVIRLLVAARSNQKRLLENNHSMRQVIRALKPIAGTRTASRVRGAITKRDEQIRSRVLSFNTVINSWKPWLSLHGVAVPEVLTFRHTLDLDSEIWKGATPAGCSISGKLYAQAINAYHLHLRAKEELEKTQQEYAQAIVSYRRNLEQLDDELRRRKSDDVYTTLPVCGIILLLQEKKLGIEGLLRDLQSSQVIVSELRSNRDIGQLERLAPREGDGGDADNDADVIA